MPSLSKATPAMRQYLEAKRQHQDSLVFFRMGDFYEMFYEDALVAARALDLTLTSRSKDSNGNGIPMCGVPHHASDGYIGKLVKKGYRVAICEQVEDPRKAKGLVKREVVRVVSPGTLIDSNFLEANEPSFLLSLAEYSNKPLVGAALLDISTGEFTTAEYAGPEGLSALNDEIAIIKPREIVIPTGSSVTNQLSEILTLKLLVTEATPQAFDIEVASQALLDQLGILDLEGFDLHNYPAATQAAGGLLAHLQTSHRASLSHIQTINLKTTTDCLVLDSITLKHLEVITGTDGSPNGSLLSEIDRTMTAMGARLLRHWLLKPLRTLERIQDRLDAVEELAYRTTNRGKCLELLRKVQDLERLVSRVSFGTAGPRDIVSLKQSLDVVPDLINILKDLRAPLIRSLVSSLDTMDDLRTLIDQTLIEDPPAIIRDGGFTRDGLDPDLDKLRTTSRSARKNIASMEEAERNRTGISSLKVRFNRVFGYYIEISKANLKSVPPEYERKQTLANGERYTTKKLKEYEGQVLGADEKILERELSIFESLRIKITTEASRVQETARAMAGLDVLSGLAETATIKNYTKPNLHSGNEMLVVEARHPVVENVSKDSFVPNNITLDGKQKQLLILTGPNMGGKSTYLRQTALLPILAQAGSFVPAREAKLPIVDRIFARVGASDNIAKGHSTFMVEMQETANILNAATSESLVILDEIGRGTSTFDGLSIAWAVAEYLATNERARPKTLFATHYHELTDLANLLDGIVNAHVSAREYKDKIVFLRKIVPGCSDRSYGIQVANLAGLPTAVTTRAKEILAGLENDQLSRSGQPTLSKTPHGPKSSQLGLFAAQSAPQETKSLQEDKVIKDKLKDADLDNTTPRQALTLLAELKNLLEEK